MGIELKIIISNPNLFPECSTCQAIRPEIDNSFCGMGEIIQSPTKEKINKLLISIQCEPVDIIESDEVKTSSFRAIVQKKVSHIQTSNGINICPGLIARKKNINKS